MCDLSAYPLPDNIRQSAESIFDQIGQKPRKDNRKLLQGYCIYSAYIENGQHVEISSIASMLEVTTVKLKNAINKYSTRTPYVPPNVIATPESLISSITTYLRVIPSEELKQIVKRATELTESKGYSPLDVCLASIAKYFINNKVSPDYARYKQDMSASITHIQDILELLD